MQRGDEPDRPRRRGDPDPRSGWETGNHRRGARRADDDPVTPRRTPGPDDDPTAYAPRNAPDGTRRMGPGDTGDTRRTGRGDPGPTRRTGPDDQGATRRVGDQGATRRMGPGDPGATRRVGAYGDQGEDPTRRIGGTRMLPQPVGGPELLGGRYRLEGLLGQGGMADVHRATDTRLNRPVAVKIFGPGNDPVADQRFEQEAQVMANLSHPGLVGVYDFAVEPQRAYLVMELVDGPTLRELIESEQLPAEEIRGIGLDVAQTLDHVHGQGITHRDVKPSNILVGSDGRARLADFGIASLLGMDGHTAAGEIIGTPAYLAPEQVRGSEVGPPADVYALGLVLLEAWTGRREYQGDGLEGAGERIHRSPVVPRDVPEPLRGAITAMTAKDPARRPTARAAADMLSDSRPDPAPAVERDDEPERDLGNAGIGRWIAIGAVVVVLLILLIGYLLSGDDDSGTPPAATTTTSERTTEAPTTTPERSSENDQGPGFTIPSLPSDLPSNIPTELPSGIPTELPSNLPDPGQIGDDASGFWEDVQRFFNNLF